MKPVLIGVGVVIAVLVFIPIAGKLMPGDAELEGTAAPSGNEPGGAWVLSVGEAMVAPSYSGRLVDTHGKPLPKAIVYMHAALGHPEKRNQDRANMPMQYTQAGGDGRFSFSGVIPGTYSVQVYWEDTADSGNFYSDAQKFWLTVSPEDGQADVTVVVPALSDQAVGGTVRDAQGRPAAGVSVEAMGRADYSRSSAKTGKDGRYLVRGIAGDGADTIWFKGAGQAELKNIPVGTATADVTLR